LIFFRLLTSGIAIVTFRKFVAHKSLKKLLNLHGFWTFVLCLSTFAEGCQQAYAYLTLKDSSDLLLIPRQCFHRMLPQFFGICGSVSSLLVMSFERYEASRNISTYESSTTQHGLKFVAIHVKIAYLLCPLHSCVCGWKAYPNPCYGKNSLCPRIILFSQALLFNSELFVIFFCSKMLKRNESLYASDASRHITLSERYQLSENIRVIRLLLPIDTINMVYLQGIALPLIFFFCHRNKQLSEMRIFATNTTTGQKLITTYDQEITKGW
ncbi:hypothetical protein PENTCL1PPCAC_679, partial [Pristionchus entomophagus]